MASPGRARVPDIGDAWIPHGLHDLARGSARTIIHDKDFYGYAGLIEHACQRFPEQPRTAKRRYHDANVDRHRLPPYA